MENSNPDRNRRPLRRPTPQDHSSDDANATIYLWLCCEGWVQVGPYKWLRFDDDRKEIYDSTGDAVATRVGNEWKINHGRYKDKGMLFSNPTITSTPQHPHPNRSQPKFKF